MKRYNEHQLNEKIKTIAAEQNFKLSEINPGYLRNLVSFAEGSQFKTPHCLTLFIERALRTAPVKNA